MREAFSAPKNQNNKLFGSKPEAEGFIGILKNYDLEPVVGEVEDGFVVLWYPKSDSQKRQIEKEFGELYLGKNITK